MKHTRTDYLKAKIRGKVVRLAFVRRRVRVARACSECGIELAAGSLFWRRGHRSVHIECFEALQRRTITRLRGIGGRRPVLDDVKMAAITVEVRTAKQRGVDPDLGQIAKAVGASKRTVQRFIDGSYLNNEQRTDQTGML